MKRFFRFVLLLLVAVSFFSLPKVFAHPGNTTNTEISIFQEENATRIEGTIYLPWVLALEVLGKSNVPLEEQANIQYTEYKNEFYQYFEPRLAMTTGDQACAFTLTGIPELPIEDVLVGGGLQIKIKWICKKGVGDIVLKNSLFLETPDQNNTVMVVSPDDFGLLQLAVLSKQAQYMVIGNITDRQTVVPSQTVNNTTSDFLVSQITTAPILVLLFFVFLLGLLHTLEAGHSKTLLAAAILDHRINWKQAISVAAIFTVTHVADIVVMGLLFLFASAFIDVYGKLPYLQIFSMYSLLFIAGYQVLMNLATLIKKVIHQRQHQKDHKHESEHSHDHDHHEEHGHSHEITGKTFKQQVVNGFLAGIAPCLFGWSIFMLILATRQTWMVIPTILSFGLGIFGGLLIVVFSVSLFKNVVFSRYQRIAELSPLVASILLFVFVLLQLLR